MNIVSKVIAVFVLAATSASALADPKVLNCTQEWSHEGKDYRVVFRALFETNDFSKESPSYELTYLENNLIPDKVGVTTREAMTVTASTISLAYCATAAEGVDSRCNSKFINRNFMSKYDISREDLTFAGGSCTISDYKPKNLI